MSHEFYKIMSDLQPHIVGEFILYHEKNPGIYELFKKYAKQLLSSGRTRFSSRAIIEKIRWEINLEWTTEEFKIKDHIIPCYARLLMFEDPAFDGFFARRKSKRPLQVSFDDAGQAEFA